MFLALLLVCNSHNECLAVKSPELYKTYDECVKELGVGVEMMAQQNLTVEDLLCVQFSVER